MINIRVRVRNKQFWLSFIPAALLLIAQICSMFGLTLDVSGITAQLTEIVTTVFLLLSLLGIVADPTTEGIADSDLALTYDKPKPKGE